MELRMGDLAGSGSSKNSKNMKIEPINRIFHFCIFFEKCRRGSGTRNIFFEFLKNLIFLSMWRTKLGAPQKKLLWRRFCGAPSKSAGAPQKVKKVRHR